MEQQLNTYPSIFLRELSPKFKIVLAITTFVLFSIVHPFFHNNIGPELLAAIPVVLVSWLWGLRAGLLMILLSLLADIILQNFYTPSNWSIFLITSLSGTIILLCITIVVGYLSDLKKQLLKRIKAHEQTEKALKESEHCFRELFNNMSNGVAIYEVKNNGEDFIIKDINKGAEKIERVAKEDIIGRNVADVFPGVSKFGLFEVFRRVWQTGQAEWHPISLYQDKRIAGWRENYVYKLPSGEIVAVYADITARKQAEEALQKSQEQFQTITETSPIPIVMTDKTDSKIIFANSAMAKLIGLSKEEFIGKKSTDFYAEPAQRAELIELLKKNKNVQNKELAFKDTKGKILCLLASFTEMMFESKDIILSALLDITERKKAAAELQKSREKLIVSEKLASLGRVSAGVAHELNNPLAAVLVMTQFLIKKTNLEDPNLKPLKIMEESILRCKDIVQNLLGFARQSDLVLKNIDLSGPLKYTFLILNNELTQKKIKVNIDLPLDLPKIKFDQGQLSQVFINIISNSIDALDEGGYITVQAQSDEQNQHLILTFADNGAGIASHDLPYIFEPFYTTKLDGKGTGLGLSITYNIMRQHQALIECESKKGEGAVFTLKFPLAPLETRAKNEAVTMAA